ncbi:MAG: alpha/beta hydrolase [Albidovulum sp.]|nr:alpha/beta hydrolase [Albidovulum sp.]MDE0530329.1 alpha/beta hydrolase [Albidovulum sp.]
MTDFNEFDKFKISTNGINLAARVGGKGPPLLLLHGFPQNGNCWSKVAPALSEEFMCIVPDLRGYGESDKPADDCSHSVYSKRTMATDIVGVLDFLGLDKIQIAGHDRGARVAYRFALDHPRKLQRLAILDVVPTGDFWAAWNADLAISGYHWTFLAQPSPLPERMICADPVAYIDWTLASWTATKSLSPFENSCLDSYRNQARDYECVTAMCADYRAGAFADRRIDTEDRARGAKIQCPLHFIWSEYGFPSKTADPLGIWSDWATDLTGEMIKGSGHFILEEKPDEAANALVKFFMDSPLGR